MPVPMHTHAEVKIPSVQEYTCLGYPSRWANRLDSSSCWTHVGCMEKMVPRGLEPRTLRLLAVRSNQLSYETFILFNFFS